VNLKLGEATVTQRGSSVPQGVDGELAIAGARLISLRRFDDARGSFCEAFRASWIGGDKRWVQWNVSRSAAGVVRGLHYHRLQTDYWHLVDGTATAALVDVRPESPTRGVAMCVSLDASNPQALVIPPGILHGFYAATSLVLMYLLDQEYDAGDEYGVRWNDPALGLPASWYHIKSPIVSPRDAGACDLAGLNCRGMK
jgi:dTDP-4-dehydrorhamnose 3,5-epimerase